MVPTQLHLFSLWLHAIGKQFDQHGKAEIEEHTYVTPESELTFNGETRTLRDWCANPPAPPLGGAHEEDGTPA